MKISKTPLYATAGALCLALASGSAQAVVIINDSFADGDRTSTGALDANWWSSSQTSGSNVQADPNSLTLVTGTSGRGMHATFATQTLAVGDSITATYSFTTPNTVGTNKGGAFKIALMDGSNPALADDLFSQSGAGNENPIYQNLPGYMADYDVNKNDATDDISIREHDAPGTVGRFLGTTSGWTTLGTSSDVGYDITADTDYIGVLMITRTGADSVDIFSSLSLAAGGLLDSHTRSDTSGIANNFGMLGFWAISNTFGSSNTAGDPDNGLVFTNVLIESTVTPIPVPGAVWLFGSALAGLSVMKRKRS